MKRKLISIIFTAALLSLAKACFAQGFVNLNFESATLVPVPGDPYGSVQFAQAFPGWTATYVGGGISTNALYNNVFLNSAGISIIDHNWTNSFSSSFILGGLIQGNYTAILQAGLPASSTFLSQTGLVPVSAQSLQFEAFQTVGGTTAIIPFGVTLAGQALFLVPLANGANYTLYGANISSWAGQTAQLSFTVFAQSPYQNNEYLYLDAIQFSTQSIPEPSAFALAALGALFLGFRRRKR